MPKEFVIFAGTANPDLTAAIAADLGMLPAACAIERHGSYRTRAKFKALKNQAMGWVKNIESGILTIRFPDAGAALFGKNVRCQKSV